MWYLSKVFNCLPFLPVLMTSIVSAVVSYVCPVFNIWFEYPELALLLLIEWMCSLYLVHEGVYRRIDPYTPHIHEGTVWGQQQMKEGHAVSWAVWKDMQQWPSFLGIKTCVFWCHLLHAEDSDYPWCNQQAWNANEIVRVDRSHDGNK
jgi:hypothetical protein